MIEFYNDNGRYDTEISNCFLKIVDLKAKFLSKFANTL